MRAAAAVLLLLAMEAAAAAPMVQGSPSTLSLGVLALAQRPLVLQQGTHPGSSISATNTSVDSTVLAPGSLVDALVANLTTPANLTGYRARLVVIDWGGATAACLACGMSLRTSNSTSVQVVIVNGAVNTGTGPWVNLTAGGSRELHATVFAQGASGQVATLRYAIEVQAVVTGSPVLWMGQQVLTIRR